MPSLARLSKRFRAPGTNGHLDHSITWRVSVQKPLAPLCCVLGKDTLWHFPLLGGLDKQF